MALPNRVHKHLPNDPWWHVFGLSSGLLFAIMLMFARLDPDDFERLDAWFENAVKPLQTFGHIELFLAITVLGSVVGITVMTIGAAFFLRRNRLAVLQLFLLMVFSSVSMGSAKFFVERARPNVLLWLDPSNTYSFPSGHATLSTALYGFIAVQLYRRSTSTIARYLSILVPAGVILLVSWSRIVLNYHYFTDVTAGILLGLFWLAVIFMLPKPRGGLRVRR